MHATNITSPILLHMGFEPPICAKLHSQFIFRCTVWSTVQITLHGRIKGGILIRIIFLELHLCCCASNSNQVSICLEFTKQPFIFMLGEKKKLKKIKAF